MDNIADPRDSFPPHFRNSPLWFGAAQRFQRRARFYAHFLQNKNIERGGRRDGTRDGRDGGGKSKSVSVADSDSPSAAAAD